MKKPVLITILALGVVALCAAALLAALGALGGSVDDTAVAPCLHPPTQFDTPRVVLEHREVGVHFTCNGARLAGILFLPLAGGRHAAVVWVHGSGEQPRLDYGPVVAPLVEHGIAVFSYDKRGVGESEGDCCTSPGQYDLVAADADGAVARRSIASRYRCRQGWVLRGERGGLGRTAGGLRLSQACCLHGTRRWPGSDDRRGEGLERRSR